MPRGAMEYQGALRGRINGTQPHQLAHFDQLRLSAPQEEHLKQWILRQETLGYAPTHGQVRAIAASVLKRQGDNRPLRKKWSTHFVRRHQEAKTKLGRQDGSCGEEVTLSSWWREREDS